VERFEGSEQRDGEQDERADDGGDAHSHDDYAGELRREVQNRDVASSDGSFQMGWAYWTMPSGSMSRHRLQRATALSRGPIRTRPVGMP
jgi:hypothetical protein